MFDCIGNHPYSESKHVLRGRRVHITTMPGVSVFLRQFLNGILGPQVFGEPRGGHAGSALELIGVGGEVTAGVQLEPLGLVRSVKCRQREIGRTNGVVVADDHQHRRRRYALHKRSGVVFRVQLE